MAFSFLLKILNFIFWCWFWFVAVSAMMATGAGSLVVAGIAVMIGQVGVNAWSFNKLRNSLTV